jgi:hypothetical protein
MIKRNELTFVVVFALVLGVSFGAFIASRYAHNAAIQNECAHYDMKTGEFKWGNP